MIAQIPLPDPVAQPAPGWLLWSLLMLTFALHLLAMNLVLGGSIIAAVSRWRARRAADDVGRHHRRLCDWLIRAMPSAVAATITLGVAPLLFLQVLYGRLFFASSILMGWFWFAVIPLLLVAYGATYWLAFRERGEAVEESRGSEVAGRGREVAGRGTEEKSREREGQPPARGWVAWLVALLFLAIAFIYVNDMSLMLRPGDFLERYAASGRGLQLNLDDPSLAPRFLHFGLAAVAVAGLLVAVLGLLRRRAEPGFGAWAMRHGAVWFTCATALNLLVGPWFLIAQPRDTLFRFLGGDPVATGVLAVGVVLGLIAFVLALLAIQADDRSRWIVGALAAVVLAVVAMAATRDQVRRAALEAADFEPNPFVAAQWGVIGLFAVLLVAALATVAWMLVLLGRGKGESSA